METKFVVHALVFMLFFTLVTTVSVDPIRSQGPIVYSRDQLLALRSNAVLPQEKPDIPRELRRRKRGKRAGVARRARRRKFRPVLPSIIMGNVRSLPNKMDELAAVTRHQRDFRECSVMVFTETWLSAAIPDTAVHLDGFNLVRADRTRESGKRKGGGLAVFVNDQWCNPGHITVKERHCCRDIELLAVGVRPYYLPREFSHAIVIAAYVPPSADADAACDVLLSLTSRLQTQHPQALILISGDFNHAPPSSTLPTFTQYVTCFTRDSKILDLCYANTKEAYVSSPLPPLGRADHNLVHLLPVYKPLVERQPAVSRTVRRWSDEAEDALKDCFHRTEWDLFCDSHGEDIDGLTNTVTDYINFCVDNTVPTRTVRCYPNNKPWITPDIKVLLKEKKRAFKSGNKDELKAVQRELRRKIREGKNMYRRKMEDQLQQNNVSEVWRGLKTISGHKGPNIELCLTWRGQGHCEDHGFCDFSSAFNTIQPALLRDKLEITGLDHHLTDWILDYLTNRLQFVRTRDCVSNTVVCSTGAPQGTVLAPFLFTLYTADFSYNSPTCHLQKFSDDSAIVCLITDGDDREYRELTQDFVDWCQRNRLQINAGKTKELVVDFRRRSRCPVTPVKIQGTDIEVVSSYKYLGVHLNNKLDWSTNSHSLYKKGQSRLYLLRRLRSFGVRGSLLKTFYDTVVASAIFHGVVCWGSSITAADRKRLDRLIKKAGSVLGCSLDSVGVVVERRMTNKLSSMMKNHSHPLQGTLTSLESSFSDRLLHPRCVRERYRRSFLPTAVRLYNQPSSQQTTQRTQGTTTTHQTQRTQRSNSG